MPSIQRLAIWCTDVEWCDLTLSESKLLCIVDVVEEERVEFVSV
jgi:hypothetical protein